MSRVEENNVIINTMIRQLGGNIFFLMTGTKPLAKNVKETSSPWVSMKLKRNKSGANHLRITYIGGLDLYRMEFIKVNPRKHSIEILKDFENVYDDMLVDIFESTTGFATHL